MSTQGSRLTVTTQNAPGTAHSAINWQSFSIPQGSTTYFQQPSATSTSINRVLGADPSAIFGTLGSNGRLVLVNPSGITVGAGAVVDTAGFTASALRMSDADALVGRMRFGDGSSGAGVLVDGQILARGGDVALIGSQVQAGANAVITAADGTVMLSAGQKVELMGSGLDGIRLEVQAPDNAAINLGRLSGDAVGMFAGTLRHSGVIESHAVSVQGGRVVLKASGDAFVEGSGSIMARRGDRGGQVDVLGDRVALMDQASIDASGTAGGGSVRIGGDFQGSNPDIANSRYTYVGSATSIRANAGDTGQGGRVIVWSDGSTRAGGRIEARGGSQSGNGGFVEVSGKQYLDYQGMTDTRAPNGENGTLLLDPTDIDIVGGTFDFQITGSTPFQASPTTADTSTLSVGTLQAALELSDVEVLSSVGGTAAGNITFGSGVTLAWTSGNRLKLTATNNVRIGDTSGAFVYATTDGTSAGTRNGSMTITAGGSVQQPSAGALYLGSLTVSAQNITLNQSNNKIDNANLNATGSIDFRSDATNLTVSKAFANDVTLNLDSSLTNLFVTSSGINAPNSLTINSSGAGTQISLQAPMTSGSYAQNGGTLTGSGAFTVTSSFSTDGGDFTLSGPISITQTTGTLDYGFAVNAASLRLVATGGANVGALPTAINTSGNWEIVTNSGTAVALENLQYVSTAGNAKFETLGELIVSGTASTTQLNAAGTMSIKAPGGLSVNGGAASAGLISGSTMNLDIGTSALSVTGGTATNAYALIDPNNGGDINITAGSIQLTGGAGSGAYAAIVSPFGAVNITGSTVPVFTAGAGANADALISGNNASALAALFGFSLGTTAFPLTNGLTDAGFFLSLDVVQQSSVFGNFLAVLDETLTVIQPADPLPDERDAGNRDAVVSEQVCT